MKLISWNVNGLRACLGKGFLDFCAQAGADVYCLQETKLQAGQLTLDLPGYHLQELDGKKPVVLCGDLNVAHQEIDLKNPGPNRGNAGFSDQERGKMTELLSAGFVDTFRHLYPDRTGAYSWWSYRFNARKNNAGWRIDYFLVSRRLTDRVAAAEILSDVYGSDHCPVLLELK